MVSSRPAPAIVGTTVSGQVAMTHGSQPCPMKAWA